MAVAYTGQAPVDDVGAPEPAASCAAVASSTTLTPLEHIMMSSATAAKRVRLRRVLFKAFAQDLLEDEAASVSSSPPSSPVPNKAKRKKHKR